MSGTDVGCEHTEHGISLIKICILTYRKRKTKKKV